MTSNSVWVGKSGRLIFRVITSVTLGCIHHDIYCGLCEQSVHQLIFSTQYHVLYMYVQMLQLFYRYNSGCTQDLYLGSLVGWALPSLTRYCIDPSSTPAGNRVQIPSPTPLVPSLGKWLAFPLGDSHFHPVSDSEGLGKDCKGLKTYNQLTMSEAVYMQCKHRTHSHQSTHKWDTPEYSRTVGLTHVDWSDDGACCCPFLSYVSARSVSKFWLGTALSMEPRASPQWMLNRWIWVLRASALWCQTDMMLSFSLSWMLELHTPWWLKEPGLAQWE